MSRYEAFGLSPTFDTKVMMVDFRLRNGRIHSLPYFSLSAVQFEPSPCRVTLAFGTTLVTLLGRNLERLRAQLVLHAVVWVQEAFEAEARLLGDALAVVEGIEVVVR
jgi:hypothetical protein